MNPSLKNWKQIDKLFDNEKYQANILIEAECRKINAKRIMHFNTVLESYGSVMDFKRHGYNKIQMWVLVREEKLNHFIRELEDKKLLQNPVVTPGRKSDNVSFILVGFVLRVSKIRRKYTLSGAPVKA